MLLTSHTRPLANGTKRDVEQPNDRQHMIRDCASATRDGERGEDDSDHEWGKGKGWLHDQREQMEVHCFLLCFFRFFEAVVGEWAASQAEDGEATPIKCSILLRSHFRWCCSLCERSHSCARCSHVDISGGGWCLSLACRQRAYWGIVVPLGCYHPSSLIHVAHEPRVFVLLRLATGSVCVSGPQFARCYWQGRVHGVSWDWASVRVVTV
jgi:hypothetical protein